VSDEFVREKIVKEKIVKEVSKNSENVLMDDEEMNRVQDVFVIGNVMSDRKRKVEFTAEKRDTERIPNSNQTKKNTLQIPKIKKRTKHKNNQRTPSEAGGKTPKKTFNQSQSPPLTSDRRALAESSDSQTRKKSSKNFSKNFGKIKKAVKTAKELKNENRDKFKDAIERVIKINRTVGKMRSFNTRIDNLKKMETIGERREDDEDGKSGEFYKLKFTFLDYVVSWLPDSWYTSPKKRVFKKVSIFSLMNFCLKIFICLMIFYFLPYDFFAF
jgi:hypothetical protein